MDIDISHLEFIDKTLREILVWIEAELGVVLTITSLYRINDSGVHGELPLRGIDCRCKDSGLGKLIAERINSVWVYDFSRPIKKCAIYHDVGRGRHVHIQTHPNTGRRK